MKYNLTGLQRYDTQTLQRELNAAAVVASINGHGDKSLDVVTGDEAAADVVVQAHLSKSGAQHDSDIDDANKDGHIEIGLENGRTILKAISLTFLDEINVLRADAGLPARTSSQFKSAVKAKL